MAFDVYHTVTSAQGLKPGDVVHLAYRPGRVAKQYRPAGSHLALAPNEALLKAPAPIQVVFSAASIDVTWGGQKVAPAQRVEMQFEVVDGPVGSDGYELAHANGDNLSATAIDNALGYVPANKAGDDFRPGDVQATQIIAGANGEMKLATNPGVYTRLFFDVPTNNFVQWAYARQAWEWVANGAAVPSFSIDAPGNIKLSGTLTLTANHGMSLVTAPGIGRLFFDASVTPAWFEYNTNTRTLFHYGAAASQPVWSLDANGLMLTGSDRFTSMGCVAGAYGQVMLDHANGFGWRCDWNVGGRVSWLAAGAPQFTIDAVGNGHFTTSVSAPTVNAGAANQMALTANPGVYTRLYMDAVSGTFWQWAYARNALEWTPNNAGAPTLTIDPTGLHVQQNVYVGSGVAAGTLAATGYVSGIAFQATGGMKPTVAADANSSIFYFDSVQSSYFQLTAAGAFNYTYKNTPMLTLGVGGNLNVYTTITAGGNIFVANGVKMALATDNATYTQIILDAPNNVSLYYNLTNGKLIFLKNGVPLWSVDGLGNMVCKGTITPNGAPGLFDAGPFPPVPHPLPQTAPMPPPPLPPGL